jgi:hypothetical protein
MRMVFTRYTGDIHQLSDEDRSCLDSSEDLFIDIPMSLNNQVDRKNIQGSVNLRNLLKDTYPGARYLHEFATESVRATGIYPVSSIVRTPAEDLREDTYEEFLTLNDPEVAKQDTAQCHKILKKPGPLIKSTVKQKSVEQFKHRATLKSTIKGRTQQTRICARSGSTLDQEGRAVHDVCDETLPEGFVNNKVGYKPRNIREARAHSTWPAWKAAMEKEVRGLLNRGTWVEVQRSQVPKGIKIMGSQFIFKDKFT